jgi:hypothetical protein
MVSTAKTEVVDFLVCGEELFIAVTPLLCTQRIEGMPAAQLRFSLR